MLENRINLVVAKVLVMGLTFKEDCPDIRNTKVTDVIGALNSYSLNVDVYDPWVDSDVVVSMSDVNLIEEVREGVYDAVVLAVKHQCFLDLGVARIKQFCKRNSVIYDLKSAFGENLTNKGL